jgi:ABC-type lipoprotein release transport system permease subunit
LNFSKEGSALLIRADIKTMKSKRTGFWIRTALLFLIRSGRATATLSIMVITAVSALIFLSALSVGVNDAMLRNTVGLYSGHITGTGIAASVRTEDLMTQGVKEVLKRVYLPGMLSNDNMRHSLMLCGVDTVSETTLTAFPKTIIRGDYPENGHSQLLVSRFLAEKLRVQTGSTLLFTSEPPGIRMELVVSGIYQTRMDKLDREYAFCPLDVLPHENISWSAAVFLHHDIKPRDIIDVYREKWSDQYRFESWETLMPDLLQLINLGYVSMSIVIILVFGVVSVGIACSFVIFIIKNMREYGVMKAMGVTTREISTFIIMKVMLMNAVACALGLVFGCLTAWAIAKSGGIDISAFTSHNKYFTVSGVIYPRLTVFSLFGPPATALVFSLIAAIWPALMIAKRKSADIIRMI